MHFTLFQTVSLSIKMASAGYFDKCKSFLIVSMMVMMQLMTVANMPDCETEISRNKTFKYIVNMNFIVNKWKFFRYLSLYGRLFFGICFTQYKFDSPYTNLTCNSPAINSVFLTFIPITKESYFSEKVFRSAKLFFTPSGLYETTYGDDSVVDIISMDYVKKKVMIRMRVWYSHTQVGSYFCSFFKIKHKDGKPTFASLEKDSIYKVATLKKDPADIILIIRSKAKRHSFGDSVAFTCDWEDNMANEPEKKFSVHVSYEIKYH